jgi:hypothetical protein
MTRFVALILAWFVALALVPMASAQTAAPPAAQPPVQAPPTAPPTAPSTEPPPGGPTVGDDLDTIKAGKAWLALLDSDKAGAAWDLASKQLQNAVKRAAFVAESRRVRKPLGKLDSRTEVKFARAHDLPGAPPGDYAIIEYDAKFKNGKHLSEQLIWAIEEGGTWRVNGYYYR